MPTELPNFSWSKRRLAAEFTDACLLTLLSIVPCMASLELAMQFPSVMYSITTLG